MDEKNRVAIQALRKSPCVTLGKLHNFSVPYCSYCINEKTDAGLNSLIRLYKSKMKQGIQALRRVRHPVQRQKARLSNIKCMFERERLKRGSESNIEGKNMQRSEEIEMWNAQYVKSQTEII